MNNKYIFGALAVGLVIAVLILGYFQFVANSSDEDETIMTDATENQAGEENGADVSNVAPAESYFEWCGTTVPGALQGIVQNVVARTQSVEQGAEEVNTLFASVTPPEDVVLLHNTRAELFSLLLPGYLTAQERAGDSDDFATVILGGLDADQQARVRELNAEARTAYDALSDTTKTAAQEVECFLFEDLFPVAAS